MMNTISERAVARQMAYAEAFERFERARTIRAVSEAQKAVFEARRIVADMCGGLRLVRGAMP